MSESSFQFELRETVRVLHSIPLSESQRKEKQYELEAWKREKLPIDPDLARFESVTKMIKFTSESLDRLQTRYERGQIPFPEYLRMKEQTEHELSIFNAAYDILQSRIGD